MSKHYVGFELSGGSDGDAELNELHAAQADLHVSVGATDLDSLAHADQLARDFAEIERAVVALRKAEPRLEPWAEASVEDPLAVAPSRAPSVWLVIGALWLLLLLIGGCAVASIAHWSPAHAGLRSTHASVGVAVGGGRKHRADDDLQIEPQRPIVYIK
jgi:hypothetical protein